MKTWLVLPAVALVALAATSDFAVGGDGDAPKRRPQKFKITTRRADDDVAAQAGNGRTCFTVKSPFGISRAVIERVGDEWPGAVVLRLHLKGLSSFRASNGKVALDAAVSAHGGKPEVRSWKDGKEDAVLGEKSPYRISIRVLGGVGKPASELPLKAGYFEVALPEAFFKSNPKSITLNWIGFYR